MIDSMMSGEVNKHIYDQKNKGKSIEEISGEYLIVSYHILFILKVEQLVRYVDLVILF
jgi:hypothetical protein